jgi:hypothetical protein
VRLRPLAAVKVDVSVFVPFPIPHQRYGLSQVTSYRGAMPTKPLCRVGIHSWEDHRNDEVSRT